MPRKENVKAKAWERDRRDRMNGYFKALSDLLPPQVDGRKRNKIDILIQASNYIKELQSRSDELFNEQASDAHKEELARLKKLVSQLLSRTELLSDLLHNAGITVPAEPALEKISPLKWSNKINVVLESKITDAIKKDKKVEKKKQKIRNSLTTSLKKKAIRVKRAAKQSAVNKNLPKKCKSSIEDQENHINNDCSDKNVEEKHKSFSSEEGCSTVSNTSSELSPPKCEIKNHKKVKRKKAVLKKTNIKDIAEFNSLPQGTLVFQSSKIMPVVAPIQSLTPNIIVNTPSRQPNPIILNNTQQGQMIVVQPLQTNHFQTVSTVQTMTLNTVPNIQANVLIKPQDWTNNIKNIINSTKIGGTKGILPKIREVTQTTMSYKVPIPAINKNKSDCKIEIKGKSIKGKEVRSKIKKTLKNIQDSQFQDHQTSESSKDIIDNSSVSTDKTNKKNILKRNVNTEINENEKKKSKIAEKEKEAENILTPKSILDKAITCKSIENLKQVVDKIGDDISYTKVQLKDPSINNLSCNNDKQKVDNNSLNETSSASIISEKSDVEKSNCTNEDIVNKESLNSNFSSSLKESSNKDNNVSNIQSESQLDSPKSSIDKNIEKTLPSVSVEVSNKLQAKESVSDDIKTAEVSNINGNVKETPSNEKNHTSTEIGLDVLLQTSVQSEIIDDQVQVENDKIFLNLDTNTTTTMKLESVENRFDSISSLSTSPAINASTEEESTKLKSSIKEDQSLMKAITYSPNNSFIPINHKPDSLHSDLSNDIFASLQVPSSSNNSESISPTAAFLMAFPIVSSLTGKTEVLDDDMKDDFKYSSQTPPMLLQIGAIEPNNFKINSKVNDNLHSLETQEINEPVQVKSSIEPITSVINSSTAKTLIKSLPRVINSQTLTESYKIIPVATEQSNRHLNTQTHESAQIQINSKSSTDNSSISNNQQKDQQPMNSENIVNIDNTLGNYHSVISDNVSRSMINSIPTYTSSSSLQSNFNYAKYLPVCSIQNPVNNHNLSEYISTNSTSTCKVGEESSNKYKSVSNSLPISTVSTVFSTKYSSIPPALPVNTLSRIPNKYNSISTSLPTNTTSTASSNNYNVVSTSMATNSIATVSSNSYNVVSASIPTNSIATVSSNNYNVVSASIPANSLATVSSNSYNVVSASIPANSLATVSSNSYNVVSTSITTNSISTVSSNSYNAVSTTMATNSIAIVSSNSYNVVSTSMSTHSIAAVSSNSYNVASSSMPTNSIAAVSSNSYNVVSSSIPTNSIAKVTFNNYNTVSTLIPTNSVATISSDRYTSISNSLPMNTLAKVTSNNYNTVSTLLPTNTIATVSSNKYNSISSSLPAYTITAVSSNNYNTVSTLVTTNTVATVSSTKYNSVSTTLPMNTMETVSQNKYSSISHYVPLSQTLTSSVANNSKENVYRNNNIANNHFNFPFSSANEEDLCKIQICPMEYFTVRSNEYSLRQNKDNSYVNQSLQTSNSESTNKNHVSINQDKSPKATIQSNQNVGTNNYHPGKKIENKIANTSNSENNLVYNKKTSEIQNSNLYMNDCDSKINKKITPQSSSSVQKSNVPVRSNIFPDQTETYVVTTTYEENDVTRSTTTIANNASNFSILSWTTFSPMNNNSTNYPQYDPTSVSNETTKATCENFNYLPTSKENVSVPHTASSTYPSTDFQMPTFDKPKSKLPIDVQKRSYSDNNKSRNMRLPQTTTQMQKSPRSHNQSTNSNSDYKFSTENKTKYKYPMDMNFTQNSYSNKLDLAPYHVQNHQSQNQSSQPVLTNHQVLPSSKTTINQHQPCKVDKTINYMLPDYNVHTNFSGDVSHVQPRYSNSSRDTYNSGTYKYNDKTPQIHSKYQPSSQASATPMHQENSLYSTKHVHQHQTQQNQSKPKADSSNHIQQTQQQPQQQQQQVNPHQTIRPPVNWMMTPEIKHNSNISDIILPPIGKELDFCQNNIFSQSSNYNQPSTNHQFYNNYDMTAHTFSNTSTLPSEPKKNVEPSYYSEDQTFSWSPTKNVSQSTEQNQNLKTIETPSMPSLVGDVALNSNNVTDKQNNFSFGQVPVRSTNNEISKTALKDKNLNLSNRDYQSAMNSQNNQQSQQQPQHQPNSSHGMPFLSVSQLVDHEKVEKNQHQVHNIHQPSHNSTTSHHNQHQSSQHHQHNHQPQQQQQQHQPQQSQQQQPRKQRKGSNSPRSSGKKQIDMRSKHAANNNSNNSNEQIHRHHEEPKISSSTSNFTDSITYQQPQQQQQKYNQQNNDAQWRNRNCKSNYTAEALIGTTNSHTENSSHTEKNQPKYSTNYPTQNKFSGSLNSDPMSINYFPNVDDTAGSGYGQMMNQNFNHSYTYSSNANIYPSTNFIPNISNSSTNYMMSLHENTPDYLDNNFLLPPNVSTASITTPLLTNMSDGVKSNHHPHTSHHHHHQPYATTTSKHQNCDKRLYYNQQKKSKRKTDATTSNSAQNFDFPISGISSPLVEDYHHAPATFLAPPNPLYQNQTTNVYAKSSLPPPPPPPVASSVAVAPTSSASATTASTTTSSTSSGQGVIVPSTTSNPMTAMTQHHPSGTSLTNFNLSTIFPEINDKVSGYKSSTNVITQPTSHATSSYVQRTNYTDPLGQMSQSSESTTHFNNSSNGPR